MSLTLSGRNIPGRGFVTVSVEQREDGFLVMVSTEESVIISLLTESCEEADRFFHEWSREYLGKVTDCVSCAPVSG